MRSTSARRVGALARLGTVPAGAVALGWAARAPFAAVRAPGPAGVDDLLAVGAAGAAAVLLAVVTLVTGVTMLGVATGRAEQAWVRLAARLTPTLLRRLGEVALGVALTGAPAGVVAAPPALAAAPVVTAPAVAGRAAPPPAALVDRPSAGGPVARVDDAGGWLPDRPVAVRRTVPAPVRLVAAAPRLARAPRETVVVRRGDSLWVIAARHLGPTASPADVAAEWPRWYAANRAVIGPDPALLRPGQQLRPPSTRG